MKYYFIFWLLLAAHSSGAQNYSCVSTEYKTFFINGENYLLGTRIDSVHTIGSYKIYFPFKTARARNDIDSMADTSGGSWLGTEIIEDTAGGTTFIPTITGDTIMIRNSALLHGSWIFFRDTSAIYYKATVIRVDTATYAGIEDSVKIIRINVHEGDSIVTTHPLNNLKLILSQHHGFFQVTELYLFPYPFLFPYGMSYTGDYYFLQSLGNFNELHKQDLIFHRISFHYPTNQAIYDFEPEEAEDFYSELRFMNEYVPYSTYESDLITGKETTDSTFSYQVNYHRYWHDQMHSGSDSGIAIWNYHQGFLTDTAKMPEEWFSPDFYHYWPADSSYCIRSDVFQADNSLIGMNGWLNHFEAARTTSVYKERLGRIKYSEMEVDMSRFSNVYKAKKEHTLCNGRNQPLNIGFVSGSLDEGVDVYPNPAREAVNIRLIEHVTGDFLVSLYDLSGRIILQKTGKQKTLILETRDIAPGIYFLHISSGQKTAVRKISILH